MIKTIDDHNTAKRKESNNVPNDLKLFRPLIQ